MPSRVYLCTAGYPLRPELMESTFLLHAATGDPRLLSVGAALHKRLRDKNRVACGYASVGDVSTGQLEVGAGRPAPGVLGRRQVAPHGCPAGRTAPLLLP